MVGAAWSAGALGAAPGGAAPGGAAPGGPASKKSMAEARAGLLVPGGASSVPGGRLSIAHAAAPERVERRLCAPTEPNEGVLASAAAALAEGWSSAAREFAEHCGNYERAQMERCGSSRAEQITG